MTSAEALEHAVQAAAAAAARGVREAPVDPMVVVLAIVALVDGQRTASAAPSSWSLIEHRSVPALQFDDIVVCCAQ